jgi:malate dehydrogenase (quinone)
MQHISKLGSFPPAESLALVRATSGIDRAHARADMKDAMTQNQGANDTDVILVGAGIMSATLGVLLKELEPALNIGMFETLDGAALESSDAWNNAGTGHAANCELNYTPERSDGSIDISKALEVNVEFDLSRQLWSYLVKKARLPIRNPSSMRCHT